MKKLLIALFSILMLAGCAKEPEVIACYDPLDNYEIDPVATANAPWRVGDRIVENMSCEGERIEDCYTLFLGITERGYVLIQDFYVSGERFSDPYEVRSTNMAQFEIDERLYPAARAIHGLLTLYYKNGQKMRELHSEHGYYQGAYIWWYNNGQKGFEIHYQDNLAGSSWDWYENGQLGREIIVEETDFKGFFEYKKFTRWYENGQMEITGYLGDFEPVGIWRIWDEDGNLISEIDYGTP